MFFLERSSLFQKRREILIQSTLVSVLARCRVEFTITYPGGGHALLESGQESGDTDLYATQSLVPCPLVCRPVLALFNPIDGAYSHQNR